MSSLPSTSSQSLHDPRRHVRVQAERVRDVSSTDFPGHWPDEDHSWDLNKFKEKLRVEVTRVSNRSIEFDLVGVDASIANAFRRILLAEVPTVCIEHVYVWNNTSVMVDEVFAHRLGMIPLNVDPAMMEMRNGPSMPSTDRNTLVFRLQAACQRNKNAPKGAKDPSELYINSEVLSSHLQWVPQGEQDIVFAHKPPAPTNPNIVLVKLRPGQEVDMEIHAVKGVGKDHAKFSPVATASYRTLPLVVLNPDNPVPSHLAEKFQNCFSSGVIEVDPDTKRVSVNEQNMRKESMSREVLRHPEFEGSVELKRVRDYFLFNIESEGPYSPERLFPESIKVMRNKIVAIRQAAESLLSGDQGGGGDVEMMEG